MRQSKLAIVVLAVLIPTSVGEAGLSGGLPPLSLAWWNSYLAALHANTREYSMKRSDPSEVPTRAIPMIMHIKKHTRGIDLTVNQSI